MKTAVINLKVDPTLKAKAQKRAKDLGVPLSYILHTQLLNFTRGEKVELPSEIMTPQMEKLIEEFQTEIAQGDLSPNFDIDDIEGMKRWLKSKDDR